MAFNAEINSLAALVQRMAEESGNPQDFDTRSCLDHGLVSFVSGLGQRRPLDILKQPGGLDLLRGLLLPAQSCTFS